MKVILFCGGLGMRIREASAELPKPLIPICDLPIVAHLMKYYIHFGHNDFILCLGYLGNKFLEYFTTYSVDGAQRNAQGHTVLTVDLPGEGPTRCRVTLVETGASSCIGERLRRVESCVTGESLFLANYADGLCDLDLNDFIASTIKKDRILSMLTVKPRQTFHVLSSNKNGELIRADEMGNSSIRVNGGFFMMRPQVFEFLRENEELLGEPMQRLIELRQVLTYPHNGFWACMDTLKEKQELDERCQLGDMPWQVWKKNGNYAQIHPFPQPAPDFAARRAL